MRRAEDLHVQAIGVEPPDVPRNRRRSVTCLGLDASGSLGPRPESGGHGQPPCPILTGISILTFLPTSNLYVTASRLQRLSQFHGCVSSSASWADRHSHPLD